MPRSHEPDLTYYDSALDDVRDFMPAPKPELEPEPEPEQATSNVESDHAAKAQAVMDSLVENFVGQGMSTEEARAAAEDTIADDAQWWIDSENLSPEQAQEAVLDYHAREDELIENVITQITSDWRANNEVPVLEDEDLFVKDIYSAEDRETINNLAKGFEEKEGMPPEVARKASLVLYTRLSEFEDVFLAELRAKVNSGDETEKDKIPPDNYHGPAVVEVKGGKRKGVHSIKLAGKVGEQADGSRIYRIDSKTGGGAISEKDFAVAQQLEDKPTTRHGGKDNGAKRTESDPRKQGDAGELPQKLKTALELAMERPNGVSMAMQYRADKQNENGPFTQPPSGTQSPDPAKGNGSARSDANSADGNIHNAGGPTKDNELAVRLDAYHQQMMYARDFINKNALGDLTEVGKALFDARTLYAEASVEARRGKLFGNRKSRSKLDEAMAAYENARDAFLQEQLGRVGSLDIANKRAFVTVLSAREMGALMGEEANYYLELNSDEQKTWLDKKVEAYNSLSGKKKVALGIGMVAAGGVLSPLVGLAGVGAGAGAAIAGRFGRGWFTSEAKRRGLPKTDREKQQTSTLQTGNWRRYMDFYTGMVGNPAFQIRNGLNREEENNALMDADSANSQSLHDAGFENVISESEVETKSKRKVVAKAAGMMAAGAALGAVIDNFDSVRGWFGGSAETPDIDPGDTPDAEPSSPEADPDTMPETEDGSDVEAEPTQEPEPTPESEPDPAPTEAVSERSRYLFGELAGDTVNIEIPEGGNIWDQLEATVDAEAPGTGFQEKQRLVGNMIKVLEDQNPGRDLNLVHPGESFNLQLPS